MQHPQEVRSKNCLLMVYKISSKIGSVISEIYVGAQTKGRILYKTKIYEKVELTDWKCVY